MKHTLVATMADGPAVLNRVVSLFRQRGFAIDSLTIGKTHESHVMRLTMVVDGSKTAIEQVVKQLYKVIEVRNLRKAFGSFVALDDVSLDVPNGSLLAPIDSRRGGWTWSRSLSSTSFHSSPFLRRRTLK